jgi:hypothetical protein
MLLGVFFVFTSATAKLAQAGDGGMSGGTLYCGDRPLSESYVLPSDLGDAWQNFQTLVTSVGKHLPKLSKKLAEVGSNYFINTETLNGCQFIENKNTYEKLEFRKLGIGKLSTPIMIIPSWNIILIYPKFNKLPIEEQTRAILNESLRGLCGVSGVSAANCVQQSKNVLASHFLEGERNIDAWQLAAELTGYDNSHPKSLPFSDVGLPGKLAELISHNQTELNNLFKEYIKAKGLVVNKINSENQKEKYYNECSLSMETPVEFINNEAQFTVYEQNQEYFPYVRKACEKADAVKAEELTKIVNKIEAILSETQQELEKIQATQGLSPNALPISYMWGSYSTFFKTLTNGTRSYDEYFINNAIKE